MDSDLTKLTAEMFVAYVSNNKVEPGQVERIVRAIGQGLSGEFEAAEDRNLPQTKHPQSPSINP